MNKGNNFQIWHLWYKMLKYLLEEGDIFNFLHKNVYNYQIFIIWLPNNVNICYTIIVRNYR